MTYFERVREWWFARASETETTLGSGIDIWTKGGWAMIALVVISLFIFAVGFRVLVLILAKRTGGVEERTWRMWIYERSDRSGAVGEIFDTVDSITKDSKNSVHDAFAEVRTAQVEPFARDLRLMNIAVGAAPLVGLLGTVTGMLATFDGMSKGGGGDKTMSMIAEGISEALYTTETGLMVALPGVFFHYFLSRRFERFRNFLDHAETVWAQERLNRSSSPGSLVKGIARDEIAKRLAARLRVRGGKNALTHSTGPDSTLGGSAAGA